MKKQNWIWMPHPGHLCVSRDCKFHLSTYVGGYLVSTVGEYFPDSAVREVLATSRKTVLQGKGDERRADYMKKIGYEEIGHGRLYESMVFRATRSDDACCPWQMMSGELEMNGYNDPVEAMKGHLKLCNKWSRKT